MFVNYSTNGFDKKMKSCLQNDKHKFIRISKLGNDGNRLNEKINHIKHKLSHNNKKCFSCNNEKIYVCKY
jgi:hypothetical protein